MVDTASLPESKANHNKDVSDYYSQTWMDYLLAWINLENLALHFGYQDETSLSHSRSLSHANMVLADRIGIRPGERVLDSGCGLGGSSFWLATNRGATTTGIALGLDQIVWATGQADPGCSAAGLASAEFT